MFNVGDKVILKSGGPAMTVIGSSLYKGRIEVWCRWYDEKSGRYEARYFEVEALELYEEPKEEQKRDIGYK